MLAYLSRPGYSESDGYLHFEPYFWLSTTIILTAGTLFVMWLGEKITDKGLGNGSFHDHHGGYPCPSAAIIVAGMAGQNQTEAAVDC